MFDETIERFGESNPDDESAGIAYQIATYEECYRLTDENGLTYYYDTEEDIAKDFDMDVEDVIEIIEAKDYLIYLKQYNAAELVEIGGMKFEYE